MTRHRLEVADVFRACETEFFQRYGRSLSTDQRRVHRAILACRTQALGGHLERCDRCGFERPAYNSCRNRHCPKCQAAVQAQWMEQRSAELLPVPYFHVVFTLPALIGRLALQNKRVVYGILFQAAAQTLKELTADPKHLGAEIGVLAVLHTWGQTLMHHPHLHCIVTGGGLARDGSRWVHGKRSKKSGKEFFVHVDVLSQVFRGKFIYLLKRAYRDGKLSFHGDLKRWAEPEGFEAFLNRCVAKPWVINAQRPFGGPDVVLKYLARYTHRVAIANSRLVSLEDGEVTFRYKDYADEGRSKTMTLEATEFVRRFLLHVLPKGFMRIRHYGFLANRSRRAKLNLARQLLGVRDPEESDPETAPECRESVNLDDARTCPECSKGQMNRAGVIRAVRGATCPSMPRGLPPPWLDTS